MHVFIVRLTRIQMHLILFHVENYVAKIQVDFINECFMEALFIHYYFILSLSS